ncbi:ANTAR domain-containing protein [Kribbella amoyensis]|uniref:ANTAR domain-containing protein n=1 Tax=Kribbella amoyensis TaxID=996641 RepID=A0A561BX15_9ACTN|nr:ANTAR domain-containing protein [Kribbella amoyensis]TWD83436.1 ANTAR domain-containing protein [Kribbella amoyensis]
MAEHIIAIAQELAEVSRLVETDDVAATLDRFVRRVVGGVPDCDEAEIVIGTEQRFEVIARHHSTAPEAIEPARATLGDQLLRLDGPLQDVLAYGEPHRIGDAAGDRRWPEFTAAMLNAGYRSALLLPLPARNGSGAAFVLFAAKPEAFGDITYDLALLFAMHAGVAFDNAQMFLDSRSLIDQLYKALDTRTVIGQAEGLLMHRYEVDAKVAFEVLKRGSQNSNLKLRDLAAELVAAQERGTLADALASRGLATDRVEHS